MNPIHRRATSVLAATQLCIALVTITGCVTGPTIGFESNDELDLTGFQRYFLLPLPDRFENADPGAALRVSKPIREEIVAGMERLGYTAVPQDEADIVLHVRGSVVPRTEIIDWGYSYGGYGRWGSYYGPGRDVTVDQYREGTLTIEAFHGATKDLAWVGWAQDRVYDRPDAEALRQAIADILVNFPPARR